MPELEITHYRETVCKNCPARREGHIKVKNIEELVSFVLEKLDNINSCHNHGYGRSQTRCKGFEDFKENQKEPGKHPEIFDTGCEFINSHNNSKGISYAAVIERYKEPKITKELIPI